MIAVIFILILVSIQFTLNMILRELKGIRIRLGAAPYDSHADIRNRNDYQDKNEDR